MQKVITFEKVYERDIDLLIMRLLSNDKSVVNFFCEKINIEDYKVLEIAHSVSDADGESDIVVKLNSAGAIHLLMIENKIDAAAQPEQYARYKLRGEKQKKDNTIAGYSICIMAPAEYITENNEAKKYDFQISYEELMELDAVKKDRFAFAMLTKAIEKQKSAGEISFTVSEFWQNYYVYQQEHFPWLTLNYNSTQKGPSAIWPSFKTGVPGTRIIHKSEKGRVDLEFAGKADMQPILAEKIKPYKQEDMRWYPTGASVSIGIEVERMDFTKPFVDYRDAMRNVLDAVSRLQRMVLKLYDDGLIL